MSEPQNQTSVGTGVVVCMAAMENEHTVHSSLHLANIHDA